MRPEQVHVAFLSSSTRFLTGQSFRGPVRQLRVRRMSEFIKAIACSELDEGSILAVRINGERIALYKLAGEVYATSEMCSHSDCSLEDFGKIVENDQVECICHGARFRIKTGEVTRLPAEVPLNTYSVRINNDEIWIRVDPVKTG
jgi:nitrite reductase/ring-hydroxylating ferredoxin subunit